MLKLLGKNRRFLIIAFTIMLLGLVVGISYYYFLGKEVQESIIYTVSNYNNFRYNFILKDLITMSLLLIGSFLLISIPLSCFYLFYESFSIGFLLNIFLISLKFKGLLYILFFIIITKTFTLLFKLLFIRKITNISKCIIELIFTKKEIIKNKILLYLKNSIIILIIILVINIILYYISPLIINLVIVK